MKAELTQENKARFFGCYLGQKIRLPDGSIHTLSGIINHKGKDGKTHWWAYFGEEQHHCILIDYTKLLLKPLSSISDEDAINAIMISLDDISANYKGSKEEAVEFYQNPFDLNYTEVDYLRSRGYALPWMGLSVEELVQAGWIRLVEV